MDIGAILSFIVSFVIDLLFVVPKFVNWVAVQLVDLVLMWWPSSEDLGIPTVAEVLGQVAAAYPFFPWGTVAQAFSVGVAVLGGVAVWKAVDLIWP